MTRTTTTAAADAVPRTQSSMDVPLLRVRRIGYAVLGLQLVGFLVWSAILYSRFALTADFAFNHQAWFLIAHGNLNPSVNLETHSFWRTHSEFVMWPLALLYWIWPHGVTMLWAQDLAIVGAEALAFTWLCELAGRRRQGTEAAWLASVGIVLFVANPWIWWTISFDFHTETIATLFAVLLVRDFTKGRRRAWAWVVLLLACGDVAATYLVGIGLGGVLASRRLRACGAVLTSIGLAAIFLITLVHSNVGSGHGLQVYGYLAPGSAGGSPPSTAALVKGAVSHPLTVLRVLWVKRTDLWADLAPSGFLGLSFPLVLPLALVILLANTLYPSVNFIQPSFQTVAVYILLPVGAVAVLGWLARRCRRMTLLLASIVAAQALGWAAVWGPRTPGQWLRVPGATATTLASIDARIPASAEVIASEGIMGRFSGRIRIAPLPWRRVLPLGHGETWFVIAPLVGLEEQNPASAEALIGELAGPLHATLVTHANGVWAFRWRPPPGIHSLVVPGQLTQLPVWIGPGVAGRAVVAGPVANWHVTSARDQGYVADGLAWQEPPGRYKALVSLSTTGPVNVEVWNDTGKVLLARRSVSATTGTESIILPVNATTAYPARLYSGWGPFRAQFDPPPPGNRLEIRVWSPGGAKVNIYTAELIGGTKQARESLLGPD